MRHVTFASSFIAMMAVSGVVAAAEPAYVGTWGVSAAQCAIPQDRQGAPMIVTAKGYDQHEAHCTFTSVKASKTGWRIKSRCSVEGDSQRHTFSFALAGETLTMTERGGARAFKRCK